MKSKFKMFQSVVLKKDVPGDHEPVIIPSGTFGAVVEIFAKGQVIVEFFDDEGWTIDIATIPEISLRASTDAELAELKKRPLPDFDQIFTPSS